MDCEIFWRAYKITSKEKKMRAKRTMTIEHCVKQKEGARVCEFATFSSTHTNVVDLCIHRSC
jgi:hypothetical protein